MKKKGARGGEVADCLKAIETLQKDRSSLQEKIHHQQQEVVFFFFKNFIFLIPPSKLLLTSSHLLLGIVTVKFKKNLLSTSF